MMQKLPSRRPMIDFCRWFLASYVIWFHFYSWSKESTFWHNKHTLGSLLQFGYLSVDLFFVISGFAIMGSLDGRTFSNFVTSRAKRLIPTFIFCSIMETLLVLILWHFKKWGQNLTQIFIASLNNILPLSSDDSRLRNFVAWSLSVEIEFYALIALFLVTCKFKGVSPHYFRLQILRGLIFFCYLCKFLRVSDQSSFSLITYLPYFILGGMLWIATENPGLDHEILKIDWIVLFPLVTAKLVSRVQVSSNPDHLLLGLTIGIILGVVILISTQMNFQSEKVAKFSNLLGNASYPLYLIGGFFGIILFSNLNKRLNLYASFTITYSLCVIVSITYQKWINSKLLVIFFGKSRKNQTHESIES